MTEIIQIDKKELREMLLEILAETTSRQTDPEPPSDKMNIDECLVFMRENGYPIKKQTLYSKIHYGVAPYYKIGARVTFSRREILAWIESNMRRPEDASVNASQNLQKSATRKK